MNNDELNTLLDLVHYNSNKLLAIKEVLQDMGIWEVVEKKANELE